MWRGGDVATGCCQGVQVYSVKIDSGVWLYSVKIGGRIGVDTGRCGDFTL